MPTVDWNLVCKDYEEVTWTTAATWWREGAIVYKTGIVEPLHKPGAGKEPQPLGR